MKSMLHEASSVLKAVEKAWTEAGRPEEFTIRVLETEKKGFLGFVKEPAVVSIIYAPRKTSHRSSDKKHERGQRGDREKKAHHKDGKKSESRGNQGQAAKQPNKEKKVERSSKEMPDVSKQKVADTRKPAPERTVYWEDEYVQYIDKALKEVLSVMKMNATLTLKPDNKVLNVTLNGSIVEKKEDERAFCVSLSYLLIQFLKKHYKKKFRGYQLHVTIKS